MSEAGPRSALYLLHSAFVTNFNRSHHFLLRFHSFSFSFGVVLVLQYDKEQTLKTDLFGPAKGREPNALRGYLWFINEAAKKRV